VKVAVVDLGTNTCRLFLARVRPGGLTGETRETRVVRLGQGVDASGRLHPDAVARTWAVLREYAPRIEGFAPARRLLVGTSVLRDAADGAGFLAQVERELGLPWRLLTGDEEGALSFRGGTLGLPAMTAPVALVDIGGGSTEVCVGRPGSAPAFVRSIDAGAVRLTERFFADDPPAAAQLEAARRFLGDALEREVPAEVRDGARAVVGVAGTYATIAAHKLGLRRYDPDLVDGHVLSMGDLQAALGVFASLTSAARGRLPGVQKGREDVILAGALIAVETLRAFGLPELRYSEADILEGTALALAAGELSPR
jgi:exopolyphosphatase/guanosine-5'-triphosphate,3'-diphosphate pyrophosphatase